MAPRAAMVAALVLLMVTACAKSISYTQEDLASDESLWALYDRWTAYNKVVRDPEDKIRRFPVFKKNAELIHDMNQQQQQGKRRNKVGLNLFGDMTEEEVTDFTSCFRDTIPSSIVVDTPAVPASDDAADIPVTVDWREKKMVTPVKNQGRCHACWAFAATGAVESSFAISLGSAVKLSEQMLVDCDYYNKGCSGGAPWRAFDFIIQAGGQTLDALYPYRGNQSTCDVYNLYTPVATVGGWSGVAPNNERALMRAVAVQPVTVVIGVDDDFNSYSGNDIYYGPGNTTPSHVVLVVGYGTNNNGNNYWIVKNSWGIEWGDKGYIYISRHYSGKTGVSGILTYPTYPTNVS